MRKKITFLILLMLNFRFILCVSAQEHLKFLGIPMDMSEDSFKELLATKKIYPKETNESDSIVDPFNYYGTIYNYPCQIEVYSTWKTRTVYQVSVLFPSISDYNNAVKVNDTIRQNIEIQNQCTFKDTTDEQFIKLYKSEIKNSSNEDIIGEIYIGLYEDVTENGNTVYHTSVTFTDKKNHKKFSDESSVEIDLNSIDLPHIRFMNIPIDGTINQYQRKLLKKGFKPNASLNSRLPKGVRIFNGLFANLQCYLQVNYSTKSLIVVNSVVSKRFSNFENAKYYYERFKSLLEESIGSQFEDDSEESEDNLKCSFRTVNDTSHTYTGTIKLFVELKEYYGMYGYWLAIEYLDDINYDIYKSEEMQDLY